MDEDFSDFPDEDELEAEEQPKKRLKPSSKEVSDIKEAVERPERRQVKKKQPIFSAYHQPERIGIKNNVSNTSIGEDVYTILADIKNDLEEIKQAVGMEE